MCEKHRAPNKCIQIEHEEDFYLELTLRRLEEIQNAFNSGIASRVSVG